MNKKKKKEAKEEEEEDVSDKKRNYLFFAINKSDDLTPESILLLNSFTSVTTEY